MGRLHARAIARRADRVGDCVLKAVIDRHPRSAARIAGEFGGTGSEDLRRCLGDIDVAVIAVPTRAHTAVAIELLENDLDVLVEKPMAPTVAEADALVQLAHERGRILQVGHVEWYNPTWRAAAERAGTPLSIEVDRLSPRSDRGLDIDVIQDFMLHDLDWVTRWIAGDVVRLKANGRAVVNDRLDEAEAELHFASGCRVRLRASRVHAERRRQLRIEGRDGMVCANLLTGHVDGVAPAMESTVLGEKVEPLDAQLADFLEACRSREAPENEGGVGVAAVTIVERVRAAIAADAEASERAHDPALRR
jgi:predicted dehydrogenase